MSRVTRNAIELKREWIDLRSVVRDVVALARPTIERQVRLMSRLLDDLLDVSRGRPQGPAPGPSGLGIGLAVVKSLVDLHGGRVAAASAGPGCGATFEVSLPASPPPQAGRAEPARAADAAGAESRTVVLVVDDNQDAVETLALLLELHGYETHTASDGAEALRTAERVRPQVVFMDLGMPTMDGYEAARRMRAERWGAGMHLVAISGWSQAADVARTRAAGFDAHFAKPVDPERVLEVLKQRVKRIGGAADGSADDRFGAAASGATQEAS